MSPYCQKAYSSPVRPAHEAEVDDIIGIFAILDLQHELNGITFVAANLDASPKFGPEEINVAAVVDRQVRVEAAIKDIINVRSTTCVISSRCWCRC